MIPGGQLNEILVFRVNVSELNSCFKMWTMQPQLTSINLDLNAAQATLNG